MLTNEQSVLEIEKEINSLKDEYMNFLTSIINKYEKQKININLNEFLECQRLGNRYFNHIEQLVGTSGLLGAHNNGKWVTGFAETCYSVLEAFITHMKFLRSWQEHVGVKDIEPNPHAYANMQRMVVEYLPNQAKGLKRKFQENQLPVFGFNNKEVSNMQKTAIWKEIMAILVGILGMTSTLYFVFKTPNPTNEQIFFFRLTSSLSASMLAVLIPGSVNIESRINKFPIKATGAIAIFIITWLINPPSLIK
jgi:hypothetical protein